MNTTDIHVLGISGSMRAGSLNSLLLQACVPLAAEGMHIEIYDRMRDLPLYDGDLDTELPPEPVADLQQRIKQADALLIVTPEYNYSIPGPLKNALDWASRPTGGPASLEAKPVALMGAAPTNFGTVRAQLALRQMFVWTNSRVLVKPEVMMINAHERFGPNGELIDRTSVELVRQQLAALATLVNNERLIAAECHAACPPQFAA